MCISHPILRCADSAQLEKKLLRGDETREWDAMQRAGAAIGEAILADYLEAGKWPASPSVLILAGKGNNAGDAFLAAARISQEYPRTNFEAVLAMGEVGLGPLARRAWEKLLAASSGRIRWTSPGGGNVRETLTAKLGHGCFDVAIDGLLGMNFKPPMRPPFDEILQWVNDREEIVLRAAVDLPTGIGDQSADLAFRADFTYMTGSAKQPVFDPANSRWCGRLRYLDIGFFRGDNQSATTESEENPKREVLLPGLPRQLCRLRPALSHKGHYGHLLIVGGSLRAPGAILMSILAAVRSGAGLVTAAVPNALVPSFAAKAPEAMWIGCPVTPEGGLARGAFTEIERGIQKASAILIGPGVGVDPETQSLLQDLASSVDLPLVIDAEALQEPVVERIAGRPKMAGRVVVTPHAGEYARIASQKFQENGENGLLGFARETGLIVYLKGPPVGRVCDGHRIAYALPGGPVLARGGSGDILSGMIGAAVARNPEEPWHGVCEAAQWHGMAAESLARRYGQIAVRTTDLLEELAPVLRNTKELYDETARG